VTVSSSPTTGPITPVGSGRDYVVVDLGGTQIRAAVFDAAGRLLIRRATSTPRSGGPAAVIAAVLDQIQQAIAEHPTTIVAVGVSALGMVDPHTGTIANAPTIPDFENVELGPRLQQALGLPVHVYNDANAAAIAEWRLGAGRGAQDFCYVTVSTGIGCGIISNGQLITGRAGYAGELGRTRIPLPDGSSAQLEQLCSGTAIASHARAMVASGQPTSLSELAPGEVTAGAVAAAAHGGDEAAIGLFTNAATILGGQLANLVRLVDPEVIALGGGVTQAGSIFWSPLTTSMRDSLAKDSIPVPVLVEAELRGEAGLHGAALALVDRS
jgi:glucokinase